MRASDLRAGVESLEAVELDRLAALAMGWTITDKRDEDDGDYRPYWQEFGGEVSWEKVYPGDDCWSPSTDDNQARTLLRQVAAFKKVTLYGYPRPEKCEEWVCEIEEVHPRTGEWDGVGSTSALAITRACLSLAFEKGLISEEAERG